MRARVAIVLIVLYLNSFPSLEIYPDYHRYALIISVVLYQYLHKHNKAQRSLITRRMSEANKRLRIYMYPVNSTFNVDLVPFYGKFSPSILSETGIGNKLNDSDFTYDTNQFALEQYFYYRLTHSKYLTNDTSEADLFYIPFFPNMAKMAERYQTYGAFWDHFASLSNPRGLALPYQLPHRHFMVYGGCQKYANAFMGHPLSHNLSLVMIERNAVRTALDNVIVAPYPAQIHFYQDRVDEIDFSAKTLLASSAWNSRYPLRWKLADLCKAHRPHCEHVELYSNSDNYNHSYLYQLTARSVFCLSPHGDSPTRKAFWDALLVGCINVIYENYVSLFFLYALPFSCVPRSFILVPAGQVSLR
jgi:hypothetical protein